MYFNNQEQPSTLISEGITKKMLAYGGVLMSTEIAFEEGVDGIHHHHEQEQIVYILDGKFEFTVDDITQICSKGDTVYIPSNISHQGKCTEKGRLLSLFTPLREDLIR